MRYIASRHAARHTDDYVFSQLIPYIGNKRKLLHLIQAAVGATGLDPHRSTFLDAFSGSGVVSRFAKQLGFQVTANDWEPYAEVLAQSSIALHRAPTYFGARSYEAVLEELNALPPLEGWIAEHLCPSDDAHPDLDRERMFYMRKNGMRLDAVRECIAGWEAAGLLDPLQRAALLAPLLYQACWLSNTSGVFKGFHRGWGGQTRTALHRIAADFHLGPARFFQNARDNTVSRLDAYELAQRSQQAEPFDIAYLDPPYNQHPYGANYHVLNTLTLWDKPQVPSAMKGHGTKSAIRRDWRATRRSAYNHRACASEAYADLARTLNARFVCTSYSTDGLIPLEDMVKVHLERGHTSVFLQGYKRYRVSTQRFSPKPMNVEFILLTDTARKGIRSVESYIQEIRQAEATAVAAHTAPLTRADAAVLPAAPDTGG